VRLPSDHERLARAFDITVTRLVPALVAAPCLALAGSTGILLAGMLAGGVGVLRVSERNAIQVGLGEVEGWGWPVEGYRAWLLAETPTFDVEVRGEVAFDVVATSAAAVDATVIVEQPAPRVLRFLTRPVELAATSRWSAVVVGDRRLVRELVDRVLAPLHADVGIAAMRMGDRATLTALVTTTARAGGAFRDQAMAAPPALQALVRVGSSQLRPPREARRLRLHPDRVIFAGGEQPPTGALAGVGALIGATAGIAGALATGGALAAVIAIGGGLFGFGGGLASVQQLTRAHAARIVARVTMPGVPIEGYDDWLLSGRPLLDVELATAARRDGVDDVLRRLGAEGTWLTDTLLRIETPPREVTTTNPAIGTFWGGDPTIFELLRRRLLTPLREEVGLVAVRMGGYVDRRR